MGDSGEITEIEGNSTEVISTEETVTADSTDEIDLRLAADNENRLSIGSDEQINIWAGAVDSSDSETPIENVDLTVEVTDPDDSTETFEAETGADGNAHIEYDVSERSSGVYAIHVESSDTDHDAEDFVSAGTEHSVTTSSSYSSGVFVDEETTVATNVHDGGEPVENEQFEVDIVDPDGDTFEQVDVETDGDGFDTVTFTPEEPGTYNIEKDGLDTTNADIAAAEYLIELQTDDQYAGEDASIAGYVYGADGPYANDDLTVRIFDDRAFQDDREEVATVSAATDESGLFVADFEAPDEPDRYYLEVETATGAEIPLRVFDDQFDVEDAPEDDDDGAVDDPEPQLNVNFEDGFDARFEPGDEVAFEAEAVDEDGEPITDESVSVQFHYGSNGVPVESAEAETNDEGVATGSMTLSESAPRGHNILRGEATLKYDEHTVTDSLSSAPIQTHFVEVEGPEQNPEPGSEAEFTVNITGADGDSVADETYAFETQYHYRQQSLETVSVTSDADGTATFSADIPEDIDELWIADVGAYVTENSNSFSSSGSGGQSWFSQQIEHRDAELTVQQDEVAPGETFTVSFENENVQTGIVWAGDFDDEIGSELATTGEEVEFTMPESAAEHDRYTIEVFGLDGDSNRYEASDNVRVSEDPDTTAAFVTSPDSPGMAEPVTFDASASSAESGDLSYEWAFGDGEEKTTEETVVEHEYDEAGTYDVTLTVEDDEGETDSATQTVTVAGSITIDGAFDFADGEPAAGDTVVVANEENVEVTNTDADGEFDIDVPESERNYTVGYYQGEFTEEDLAALEDGDIDDRDVAEFQELFEDAFPRDGSADIYGVTEVDGTENTTLETVDIPVGHVVNTTVVDGGEPVDEAGVVFVDINQETDGFADVGTLTDEDGVAQFSPDGGLELNGTVVAVAFDPDEDEVEVEAEAEVSAMSDVEGAVEDDHDHDEDEDEDGDVGGGDGFGLAFAELEITEDEDIILDLAEGGLVADLELTAEPTEADVNETEVELTLEGVEADEDEIAGYVWDLTGDGEMDTDTNEPNLNHTFEELGERDVTVEVVSELAPGSASTTVDVVDTVDPVAELEVPEEVAVGETITANASESTDNHRIADYTWELTDAEGETVETETTEEPVWNVTTEAAGEYTLEVTVTDESGNEDAASEEVSVVDAASVEVDLEADAEQNIREEVTADVVISNVGSQAIDEPFDVELQANGTTYDGEVITETVEKEVEELGPEDSETLTFDLSEWAEDERVVGELSLTAEAELDEDEVAGEAAIDTAVIDIVYADLVASSDVSDVSQGENATLRSYVGNNGTAASEEADVSVSVTDAEEDPVFENDSITADALEPEGLQRDRFTESFDEPGTYTLTVEVEDDLFPEGTESTTDFEVEPYELEVDEEATNVPSEVNRGQNFTAVFGYETNTGEDVNATLELPEEIGFAGEEEGDTETVTARSRAGGTNIVTYDLTAEERTEEPVDLNFSVEDTLELEPAVTDNTTAQTNVSIATETVSNESAVTYDEDTEDAVETVVEVYGDEVSEDHNVSISAQAGPEGRTLQGLEYLVNYPYGCVEQTTSAFLGALNTHQYYEDRDDADISDDRQEVINGSIEQGVDRLAEDGIRTQQDDGSWNQWGNEWQDGQSYFSVLALYGLSQVDNDDTYGPENEERLDDVRFNEAVDWLDDEDNWADADGYLNDEPSAIGFAIISLEEAAESDRTDEETAETIDEIYADAAEELLEQQDESEAEANSGTWNDENHRSTAFAVYGLQIILDADAYEDDQEEDIEEAVDEGASFLADGQNEDDGSWELYHDSPWWNNQGDVSKSTALSVLALDAVDDEAYADEVADGVDYLMDVYENDGSWGYPRATNMALEALIELTDEQADRTMEVTLDGPEEDVTKEITVNATDPQVTETITNDDLSELRGENDELNEVTVTVDDAGDNGTGTAVIAVQTTQEVHDDAIENGGDE